MRYLGRDILRLISRTCQWEGVQCYLVGGAVRGRVSNSFRSFPTETLNDLDIVVFGEAIDICRKVADFLAKPCYILDQDRDMARIVYGDLHIDFAGNQGDLDEDLGNRDFTMNAMAYDLVREVYYDPFGGADDLRRGLLRTVKGNSIANDPIRAFRAVRFACNYGLKMTSEVITSLKALNIDSFKNTSPERLRDEFVKILNLPNADMAIRMLDEYKLLLVVLPSVTALKEMPQSAPHIFDVFEHTLTTLMWVIEAETGSIGLGDKSDKLYEYIENLLSVGFETNVTNSTILRLGALLHDVGKAVTQSTELNESGEAVYHYFSHDKAGVPIAKQDLVNLRFSGAVIDIVSKIVEGHMRPLYLANSGEVSRRSLYRFFRDYGSTGAIIATLAWADSMATYDHSSEPLEKVVQQLVYNYFFIPEQVVAIPSLLNGNDLMRELNLSPGKQIGILLEAIREQQVEQKVNTYDEAIAYAREQLNSTG